MFEQDIKLPIQRDMEEFVERGSGWTLKAILSLTINVDSFNPMRGISYIPLPRSIVSKKACVNVQNNAANISSGQSYHVYIQLIKMLIEY